MDVTERRQRDKWRLSSLALRDKWELISGCWWLCVSSQINLLNTLFNGSLLKSNPHIDKKETQGTFDIFKLNTTDCFLIYILHSLSNVY